ncbi:MAG TPA: SCO family protein [Thermoleophilaceae bacterium]
MRSRQLIALTTLSGAALIAIVAVALAARHSGGSKEFDGSLLPAGVRAPAFDLRDQTGRRVSMAEFHGKPVIATFLYSHCKDTCPVEARLIDQAVLKLGKPRAAVVAFTVDPAHDTPASVHAFLRREQITVPFHWVLGDWAQLKPIWKGYAVTPQLDDAEHMARIVLIDKHGVQRIGYPLDQTTPDRIAHDMRLLARERMSS